MATGNAIKSNNKNKTETSHISVSQAKLQIHARKSTLASICSSGKRLREARGDTSVAPSTPEKMPMHKNGSTWSHEDMTIFFMMIWFCWRCFMWMWVWYRAKPAFFVDFLSLKFILLLRACPRFFVVRFLLLAIFWWTLSLYFSLLPTHFDQLCGVCYEGNIPQPVSLTMGLAVIILDCVSLISQMKHYCPGYVVTEGGSCLGKKIEAIEEIEPRKPRSQDKLNVSFFSTCEHPEKWE